jgi:acetate---CoA ligase (ADP-forming)
MSFECLFNPRSIAVFGGAQAQEAIRQSEMMGFDGEIWPVHPKKSEIMGRKVYKSVGDLPGVPDVAYVGVNRHLTIDIVRELAEKGCGGAVCFAVGFSDIGQEGAELQEQLMEASGDMPLIGPNTYGYLNYLTGAMLWPDQQAGKRVDSGVGIIVMSSNVGFNLTMQRRGLPIACMLSLGNKMKFQLHDAIRLFAQQDGVTTLGLYLETIPDPKEFEAAVNFARELGKPVVAVKTGRSEIGQKMVVSHTASLAGSDELVSALFKRLGVARVNSLESFVEALKVLHIIGPLSGGRIGAMSTSGGDLTLVADSMGSDLSMPPLSEKVKERLSAIVHEWVITGNPFDYQMFNWDDEDSLAEHFTVFLEEDFDISLCALDYPREDMCDQSTWGGAERGFVRAVKANNAKGAILATFADTVSEKVSERLAKDGVVMLAGVDAGVAGVQAAVDVGTTWKQPVALPLLDKVESQEGDVKVLDEVKSKEILAKNGVAVPAARVVNSDDEAAKAANELGYPVVVKALGVAHKTDVGGVKVNLNSADEVAAAVNAMSEISKSYLIEKMVEGVIAELIVGVARDVQFGPYIVVGGGGILVEMMKDSQLLLLPTTRERILETLGQLKCAPLLNGFRGAPTADVNAAADVILAIAKLVEADPASIIELDINPLMVLADGKGAIAADVLIRLNDIGEG